MKRCGGPIPPHATSHVLSLHYFTSSPFAEQISLPPPFQVHLLCTAGDRRCISKDACPSLVRNAPAVVHLRCKKEDAKGTRCIAKKIRSDAKKRTEDGT